MTVDITTLVQHTKHNELSSVKRMIDSMSTSELSDLTHRRNGEGETLLHIAVKSKSDAVACFLVERGFDPTAKNKIGQSALYISPPRLRGMLKATFEITQMKKEAFQFTDTTDTTSPITPMNSSSSNEE